MTISSVGAYLYTRQEMHKPFVFVAKMPAVITAIIRTKKKLIVKLEDGQVRYFDKRLRPFTYNK